MFYNYKDENIAYTGRWADWDNAMTATATGSRFTLRFTGEMAVLHFNMNLLASPVPHLWIQVDGGAMVEAPIDRWLRVRAAGDGPHTVTVILKSMVENFPRWHQPLTNRVSFLGVDAEGLVALPRPRKRKKTMEFVGDSITEGVLIDEECRRFAYEGENRPAQDDVTATYAWLLAEQLGVEPLMMGYGAVGVTKGGQGGVPSASQAYPHCFEGAAVTYPHPDYVFINHGTNDGKADTVTFTAGYVALLDAILTAHPKTQVIAMSPFRGTHEEDIENLVAEYNERHNQHILFVNGSHWLPKEPVHPGREGHRIAADKLAEVLKDKLGL